MLLALFLPLMVSGASSSSDVATHRAEIEAWREKRVESLRRENGWLTVVGLFWLEEGENSVGTAPDSRVRLPAGKSPARLGSIRLANGVATWRPEPRAPVTADGTAAQPMPLVSDADGASPTVLRTGSVTFYLIARGDRLGVRVKDAESLPRREFREIPNFSIDPRWRLSARFEPYRPPKSIPVPNVLGTVTNEQSPGALVFEFAGRSYRLDPVTETGTTDLFVIFGDQTNGVETYGGGRFLYAPPPDAEGRTVLDFNKAYNPPCVFTPYATCPLPPAQNKLPLRIEAGEKRYGEH